MDSLNQKVMRYSFDVFYNMDEMTFSKTFLKKYVAVTTKNGSRIEGIITEIELACNVNNETKDHLPVKIKILNYLFPLEHIEEIEVL